MRVLMLGWEFPPYISGGLGTACHGLTRALSEHGVGVTFLLPRAVTPDANAPARVLPRAAGESGNDGRTEAQPGFENVTFHAVPAELTNPYQRAQERWAELDRKAAEHRAHQQAAQDRGSVLHEPGAHAQRSATHNGEHVETHSGQVYAGDLVSEADRYARLVLEQARGETFDIIHAHDWLTFPAGMGLARATGKPLVVHIHSTEYDRAGDDIDHGIYDIERRGMHAAVRVVTVSHLTRKLLEHRYHVPPERIRVVHNGIDLHDGHAHQQPRTIGRDDPVVLFLGRITQQKGPEYFVDAARKVAEKIDRVKFVMAGSGDKAPEVIERAAHAGLAGKVTFTGFLRGEDVGRIFEMADVYVMPSVSDPFGIAALEAVRHDVPTIVSRTSGVSEVLRHALKVDFWDTDDIADKIIALLSHAPLSDTLRRNADLDVGQCTWRDAAARCLDVYDDAIAQMPK